MYYSRDGDKIFMCGMYVDDGLCLSNNEEFLQQKLKGISKVFDIVILKDPEVFVGIQIERDRDKRWLKLHQTDYLVNLLKTENLFDCNSCDTPLDVNIKDASPLQMEEKYKASTTKFQEQLGYVVVAHHSN